MVYFNPTTYSWNDILGPVLGKTRSWGWGTVFDLVPFCWGRVNKYVGGGELRAKPEMIEGAKRSRIESEARIKGAARD